MNEEIKIRWLKGLRSGEYKQGKGRLKREDSFCCLGVLCDIYLKEKSETWSEYDRCEGSTFFLPYEVRKWSGLYDENQYISIEDEEQKLSGFNDKGKSFEEIADIIEEQL